MQLPKHLREMDPIRQLAMAPDSHRTPELINALLPHAIAQWRQDVRDKGHPTWNVRCAIAESGPAGLEALATWLDETSDRALIACVGGLSDVMDANRHAAARGDITLSTEASAAWRTALGKLRRHVPDLLTYRLLLDVKKVAPSSRGKPAEVTCYQGMFVGMLILTPYTIAIRRDGRVPARRLGRIWPVAAEAMAGLHELLRGVEAGDLAETSPGWVAVFESPHKDVDEHDWRDGYEQFTASREGLTPGRVCEIRRQRGGDEATRRDGLWPVLPGSSALHGCSAKAVELARKTCEDIELLVD